MKKWLKKISVFQLLVFLSCWTVLAQEITVSGTITLQNGEPLPGASVVVKGTSTGTIADADGNFSLNIPEGTETLVFSFIGMKTKEVPITSSSTYNVVLEEDVYALEEVVAVGYGTMKKSDLTGSVSSVEGDNLTEVPATTLAQSLQGRTAGVHILQNTGAPGATIQVRIRGTNSIQGSNDPLWVVDGFPGDPNMLNPSDIESIEVLKDASATAIYGSRGANGVVIVTTKRGQAGKTKVDYEASYSIQSLREKLDLMNAKEYATFYNIQQKNDTGEEYFSENEINNFGEGTDWQDLIFRPAPISSHSLNVSGGSKKTQFSIGGSYFDQDGIIIGSNYNRAALRANVNHDISNKFNITYNAILSKALNSSKPSSGSNRGGSLLGATVAAPPTTTPYDDEGTYRLLTTVYPFSSNAIINPVAYVNETSNNWSSNRVNANLAFTYKPIDDLSIKISGNVRNSDVRTDNYTTRLYPGSSGSASVGTNNSLTLNNDNIINYIKNINDKHEFNFTAGFTYEQSVYKSLNGSGSGFLSDVFETYNLGSAENNNPPSTSFSKWVLMSYLGRINYSYLGKYLATVTFRSDGSSRYSAGNKWGYFPSGAIAYRVSEEDFMSDLEFLSDLKVRVSYGESGSTAIGPYSTLSMLSTGNRVFGNELYTYFAPSTRYPGDLKWETTAQSDFGVDASFLDYRIRFSLDYYIKNTRDLLNSVQMPRSSGYTNTIMNVGEIQNKGLELQLDTRAIDKSVVWDIGANVSFNKNRIVNLYGGQDIPGYSYYLGVVGDYVNLLREGHPMSAFYGYETDGFDENGNYKYKDNDLSGDISIDDKTFIGDPNPDFIYGINSSIKYKNFQFKLFIQGTYGNDIYSFSLLNQTMDYGFGLNTLREVLYDHWTPDNTNAKYPRISRTTAPLMSDRFVYDGSYLRLKNVELAYNIPVKRAGLSFFNNAQIYISGQNLLTLTSYPWFDPDVNSSGGSSSINQGIDYYTYPTAKSITFGVKLGF
jgi:TonB-linked SusC/RagA family outer membrane protein